MTKIHTKDLYRNRNSTQGSLMPIGREGMKSKKYTLMSLEDGYEIYAKKGTLRGKDKGPERLTQIRIVPAGPHWGIPTGMGGVTLGTLEEDGDGMTFTLCGEKLRLDYCQIQYLRYLLQARDKIDPPWWDDPEWKEENFSLKNL